VLSLTGNPAWLTDHVLGDCHEAGTSSPAAVAGYPAITVPAGWVSGLPVGVTFVGPAWSEPALIALAYAFEQADPGHRADSRQR
jgi:amidase